ncbi:MAG: hypothetical protein ACTHKL_07280 [Streptosporangiaceae bacterium]
MAEAVSGPSTSGSVVLDLGPGTGALVLHAPPELDGAEIEISRPADAPGSRTHSLVRRRELPGRVQFAAVYPGLPPGDYVIWRDSTSQASRVTVTSGQVTTACWPG